MENIASPNGLAFIHRADGRVEVQTKIHFDKGYDAPTEYSWLIDPTDWQRIILPTTTSPNAIVAWFDQVQALLKAMQEAKTAGISSRYLSLAATELEQAAHWLRDAFADFNLRPPQE